MVRFGILGFGLHAVKRVMPAFERVQHCRVTALSRRAMADAKASAAEYGIPLAFDSGEALCDSPEVDAVFVSTPDACHLRDVLTALRHGKPVLCEKPMAMSARQAEQMVAEAAKKNLLLGVAHVFRFEDSVLRARELVTEGTIGRPLFARSEFCYLAKTHTRQWLRDAEMSCGGPIGDVGVHCIDALRFILEDEPDSVFTAATYDDASALETSASMSLKFHKGTLGNVNVSILSPYRPPFEIVGEQGSIRAQDFFSVEVPVELIIETQGKVRRETISNHDAYVRQFDAFALAVEKGTPFAAPGEEGLHNQLVLDAAFHSARSGKTEIVD
ncbi:MAG: Gfo/Idh/MocA family oxidoreductase [Acidobacteriales bacterium]|nr:Gfo/Idh/MocA family oxidoreductase [Terriglobales bacterium]